MATKPTRNQNTPIVRKQLFQNWASWAETSHNLDGSPEVHQNLSSFKAKGQLEGSADICSVRVPTRTATEQAASERNAMATQASGLRCMMSD